MATTTVTTSAAAYALARKLVDDYDRRQHREEYLNKPKEKKKEPLVKEDPRRTVTQIDYQKHEETVKELDRQEKEEVNQRKREEAANRMAVGGCSHDHQKEWRIYEKTTDEKLKAADRFREEGNEYFRKNNYGLAAVQYRKALLQFDYTFADNEDEERQLEAVKVPCLLNLAACKCQQEEWDEVLTHCRLALEINPRSVKAYYRIGLAHLARDHFDEAKEALTSALEIESRNPDVIAALKRLKQNMKNYKVRTKEVAKEMVSGKGIEDEGAPPVASIEASTEAAPGASEQLEPQQAQAPSSSSSVAPPVKAQNADSPQRRQAGRDERGSFCVEPMDSSASSMSPIVSTASLVGAMGAFEMSPRASQEHVSAEVADAAVVRAPSDGLRRRGRSGDFRGAGKPAIEEAEEDDEVDECVNVDVVQHDVLRYILLGAAGLALVSVGAFAVFLAGDT